MRRIMRLGAAALFAGAAGLARGAEPPPWPANLPVYDHIVIVIEENKDFEQILGDGFEAPYIKETLAKEGAVLSRMFGEEHFSQGNYFWLFSGSNHDIGFYDEVPGAKNRTDYPLPASSLGEQLLRKGLSFKGYAEDLPAIGSTVELEPPGCHRDCIYARKHVPWISFANVPNGPTLDTSSNLRFADFPADYARLPTVAFVIPNLVNDMHNGHPRESIPAGDRWLREHLNGYYQWAKAHNSLLILTFDESDDRSDYAGPTHPAIAPDPPYPPADTRNAFLLDAQNRIATIFAGAHVKPGVYAEGAGVNHVSILRTIEAMYGLPRSGAQQPQALDAGITDDAILTDIFTPVR